jgi:hypothetical protein
MKGSYGSTPAARPTGRVRPRAAIRPRLAYAESCHSKSEEDDHFGRLLRRAITRISEGRLSVLLKRRYEMLEETVKASIVMVLTALAIGGCASKPASTNEPGGSWFMKQTVPDDFKSRRLLIGNWRSEATDIHGVRRVEDVTRNADGTYAFHFTQISEAGKTTVDQVECGKWGVSGDIYFTITLSTRQGGKGQPTSPYDPSFYDAYRIQTLTDEIFEYKHVVQQALEREHIVSRPRPQDRSREGMPLLSACEGNAL